MLFGGVVGVWSLPTLTSRGIPTCLPGGCWIGPSPQPCTPAELATTSSCWGERPWTPSPCSTSPGCAAVQPSGGSCTERDPRALSPTAPSSSAPLPRSGCHRSRDPGSLLPLPSGSAAVCCCLAQAAADRKTPEPSPCSPLAWAALWQMQGGRPWSPSPTAPSSSSPLLPGPCCFRRRDPRACPPQLPPPPTVVHCGARAATGTESLHPPLLFLPDKTVHWAEIRGGHWLGSVTADGVWLAEAWAEQRSCSWD